MLVAAQTTHAGLLRSLALLIVAACTQPAATVPTPLVITPPAPTSPAAPIVNLSAVRPPATPVIDGDLGEWGSLPPPNASGAASRLALAVSGESVLIAAELREPPEPGIWLGIGAQPAELPLLGQYFGRMGFVPLDCEATPVVSEGEDGDQGYSMQENPPETVAACQAQLARQAERQAKHERRFESWLLIDRDGVHRVSASGERVAVAGARSAWKPGPTAATLEVWLPRSAMPRLAEAPLRSLRLAARAATSPAPPALAAREWGWVILPEPVSFEPYGALRAHTFKVALDVGEYNAVGTTSYRQPRGASYQPGDPLHVEVVDSPRCDATLAHEEDVYRKQASLGDVEVGYVAAPRGSSCAIESEPWLAILKAGKLLEIVALEGSPRGVVARDGELHVLSYDETTWTSVAGSWNAVAIAPSGSHRKLVVERVAGTREPDYKPYWEGALDFASKELDSFGWRGTRSGRGIEATWRWDGARRLYAGKQRNLPPPKKPK